MNQRILITGGRGFIGSALSVKLSSAYHVRACSRSSVLDKSGLVEYCMTADLNGEVDWSDALTDVQVIVHCAARAHVLQEELSEPMLAYKVANVDATVNLARQAVRAGVKRFIFLSSIGVNGLSTTNGQRYTEQTPVNPHNDYARSKWEAEQELFQLAKGTGLEVVVIRPPLVYGKDAPGNFGNLAKVIKKRIPLPLASIDNRRSLIGIDNLVDFIAMCVDHPKAVNEVFLVSDGQDLSTTALVRGMAQAASVPARLLPVPVPLLRLAARLLGKAEVVDRLCGNLQVDSSKARDLLGWAPPLSVEEGLRRVVR